MQKHNKQAGVAHLYALVAVAVIIVVGAGWYVAEHQHHNSTDTQTASTNAPPTTASDNAAVRQPLSSGTSNKDLNSDLQNLNSSLNQDSQNLQSANQSFNDQQLPVSD